MAAERGQSSQKLVYLRDRAPRRRDRPGARKSPTPPPAKLDTEALWLGRSLFVVAGTLLLYWLGVLGGTTAIEAGHTWRWTLSEGLPHLVLAGGAGFAARSLVRSGPQAGTLIGIVAGGLLILSLEGITRSMAGSNVEELSLNTRTEVLIRSGIFAAGIWAASYALRVQRRPRA